MDYEEPAAIVVDPDEQWTIDTDVEPLVNVATFGWTEGTTNCFYRLEAIRSTS